MKRFFLVVLLFSLLFVFSGCHRDEPTLSELFDSLFDDYLSEYAKREQAETKYEMLCENLDKVYDEFLFSYFYILGDDDISHDRAVESAIFVHDFLDTIRP